MPPATKVPPMMVHGPTEESGTEGNEMSLYCKAESDPMPSYEFYKIVKVDMVMNERNEWYNLFSAQLIASEVF